MAYSVFLCENSREIIFDALERKTRSGFGQKLLSPQCALFLKKKRKNEAEMDR